MFMAMGNSIIKECLAIGVVFLALCVFVITPHV